MNYGEVLSRAWKIIWKFKVLWLLSILPALIGILNLPVSFVFNPSFASFVPDSLTKTANETWFMYLRIIIYILFFIASLSTSLFGAIASVTGTFQADKGVEKLSFVGLLKNSLPYFWKVLGLYAIFMAGYIALFVLFVGCMILGAVGTGGIAMLCIFPLFFLLIPLILIGNAILEQSQAAIIVDNLGVITGLKRVWEVLKKNFWKIVLMTLILYGGSYLFSMVVSLPMFFVMQLSFGNLVMNDSQSSKKLIYQ